MRHLPLCDVVFVVDNLYALVLRNVGHRVFLLGLAELHAAVVKPFEALHDCLIRVVVKNEAIEPDLAVIVDDFLFVIWVLVFLRRLQESVDAPLHRAADVLFLAS